MVRCRIMFDSIKRVQVIFKLISKRDDLYEKVRNKEELINNENIDDSE
jgi:hypothetical protein